ncbi:UDP-N-acetylmuramoyl-L-alanine--D-glutamate ligase [Candidatus Roizmanbacteria bacterium]|nr:UDP-N-acetylmuramoyl-L-alanine--D-glutamate ligase [Candidatus Roizmanbacteria bacterium]
MGGPLNKLKSEFKDKKVLIVGLGLQGGGVGLAKFFAKLGAKIKVTDKKPKEKLNVSINQLIDFDIQYTLGKHDLKDFLEADVVFKAPKMRWDDPLILAAQKKGAQIEMETSFFATLCPAPIIGVTGTRGKSTTTMMIYEILKKYSGKTVHLAGNLPKMLAINILPLLKPNDLVVLELSSWQLSGFHKKKISPQTVVFTNFYPDHLDYYKSMDEYLFDKKAIYLYQKPGDHLIINKSLKQSISKDKIKSEVHFFNHRAFLQSLIHLKGAHNLENAAAALEVAKILHLPLDRCIDRLIQFRGLPYRQEKVGEKGGILFINDTTSTTPTSTIKALQSFKKHQIVLILGGNSKQLPADALINRLVEAKRIILLKGSFTDEIYPALRKRYSDKILGQYDDLENAVKRAYEEAKQQLTIDNKQSIIILFSPGATSFAMFNNEFHRGDEFNKIVNKLISTDL